MPVTLTVHTKIPKEPTRQPPESTEAQRTDWVKRMQVELSRPDATEHFHADFATAEGNLHLQARRYRTAIAAIWTPGEWRADVPQDVAAVSLLLRGKDGDDDAGALEAFRKMESLALFPPKDFIEIQAKNRPSLTIFYVDPKWYESGIVELAAGGLALAIMAAPGVIPTMEPTDRQLTPEENAAIQQQLQNLLDVFQIIQNDWVTRKKLRYTVRPSEKIAGRQVSEIMHVTFWTGVQGQGRTLSVNGLVALFLMLGDYIQKTPNLQHMKNPQTKHEVSLRHEPAVIDAVLKKIEMSEPG